MTLSEDEMIEEIRHDWKKIVGLDPVRAYKKYKGYLDNPKVINYLNSRLKKYNREVFVADLIKDEYGAYEVLIDDTYFEPKDLDVEKLVFFDAVLINKPDWWPDFPYQTISQVVYKNTRYCINVRQTNKSEIFHRQSYSTAEIRNLEKHALGPNRVEFIGDREDFLF